MLSYVHRRLGWLKIHLKYIKTRSYPHAGLLRPAGEQAVDGAHDGARILEPPLRVVGF